jgi:hypothetical protein
MALQNISVGQSDAVNVQPGFQSGHFLVDDFQTVRLCVLGKFHGQLSTADVFIARPVFDRIGIVDLSAGRGHFDQHRF